MNTTEKVILGTLAGAAIGTIAGILFAPEKGSKTRKNIKNKSEDYLKEVKDKFDEFADAFTEKFENSKKNVANWVSQDDNALNDAKNISKNLKEATLGDKK